MCTGESWRYCSHFAMATSRDAYCNSEIYVSHFRHTLNYGNGMQLHVRRFTVNVPHLKLHRMWTMYPIRGKSIDKVNRRFAFGCFSYCKWLLHERSHIEWDCVHRPMWMMAQRASEREEAKDNGIASQPFTVCPANARCIILTNEFCR